MSKMKQLLMRNKKELSESKKRESELLTTVEECENQLERERQEAEETKVRGSLYQNCCSLDFILGWRGGFSYALLKNKIRTPPPCLQQNNPPPSPSEHKLFM